MKKNYVIAMLALVLMTNCSKDTISYGGDGVVFIDNNPTSVKIRCIELPNNKIDIYFAEVIDKLEYQRVDLGQYDLNIGGQLCKSSSYYGTPGGDALCEVFQSDSSLSPGKFDITAVDKRKKVLSGNFELTLIKSFNCRNRLPDTLTVYCRDFKVKYK
jgi:hypothetical protein